MDEGILLSFSSVWFGGELRLVERELPLLPLAAAGRVVVRGGVLVSEFELELELVDGSGVKSSESLSEALLWVMWTVICSCKRAERAAALRASSSV